MFRASHGRWLCNSWCDKLTRGRRRGITKAGNCGRIRFVTMTADILPDDVASLRALVLATRAERDRSAGQIERLRHIIRELRRARFGRRSEKLDADRLQRVLEEHKTTALRDEATQDVKLIAPRGLVALSSASESLCRPDTDSSDSERAR